MSVIQTHVETMEFVASRLPAGSRVRVLSLTQEGLAKPVSLLGYKCYGYVDFITHFPVGTFLWSR